MDIEEKEKDSYRKSVAFTKSLYTEIDEMSKKHHRSFAQFVLLLLHLGLKEFKKQH